MRRQQRGSDAEGGASGGNGNGNSSGGSSERMAVVVRVRNLTVRERQLCSLRYPHRVHLGYRCVDCTEGNEVVTWDPDSPASGTAGRHYAFDRVFDGDASNEEVYAATVQPLLPGLLLGYNATCFAYGMTGAGKTYTMMGTDRVKGLCYMAVGDLFPRIEACRGGGEAAVHASYLEIYNERVKDLLGKDGAAGEGRRHDIIEDPVKGVVVTDLAEYLVESLQDLHTLMALGCEKRTKASTASNVVSSRSHAILLITVRHANEGGKLLSTGKLALIDLAGSERAAPGDAGSHQRNVRQQEGANINRSLLALGNCITILGTGSKGKSGARLRQHVPYRDSKLTRLLKDSLGGNTRTVMVGNISPASTCYEEVVSTLKYATRARNISRTVTRNAVAVDPARPPSGGHPVVDALKTDIAQLRTQLLVQKAEREGIVGGPRLLAANAAACLFAPVARPPSPQPSLPPASATHPHFSAALAQIRAAAAACRSFEAALEDDEDSGRSLSFSSGASTSAPVARAVAAGAVGGGGRQTVEGYGEAGGEEVMPSSQDPSLPLPPPPQRSTTCPMEAAQHRGSHGEAAAAAAAAVASEASTTAGRGLPEAIRMDSRSSRTDEECDDGGWNGLHSLLGGTREEVGAAPAEMVDDEQQQNHRRGSDGRQTQTQTQQARRASWRDAGVPAPPAATLAGTGAAASWRTCGDGGGADGQHVLRDYRGFEGVASEYEKAFCP